MVGLKQRLSVSTSRRLRIMTPDGEQRLELHLPGKARSRAAVTGRGCWSASERGERRCDARAGLSFFR